MKTSELSGAQLDYWVARAEKKHRPVIDELRQPPYQACLIDAVRDGFVEYRPSSDWSEGGPIIERELIEPYHRDEDGSDNVWHAVCPMPKGYESVEDGPTLLIAAMRAYVASKFGEQVPNENISQQGL